jgi:hypothetical protein
MIVGARVYWGSCTFITGAGASQHGQVRAVLVPVKPQDYDSDSAMAGVQREFEKLNAGESQKGKLGGGNALALFPAHERLLARSEGHNSRGM